MSVLPIVYTKTAARDAQKVIAFFTEAGLTTMPVPVTGFDNAEAMLPMIEGSASGEMPVQAWLVSGAALDLEVSDRANAAAARGFAGLSGQKDKNQRLVILIDGDPARAPRLERALITSVQEITSGRFDLDRFCAMFNFEIE